MIEFHAKDPNVAWLVPAPPSTFSWEEASVQFIVSFLSLSRTGKLFFVPLKEPRRPISLIGELIEDGKTRTRVGPLAVRAGKLRVGRIR